MISGSLPQIATPRIRQRTSPWPGFGMATSRTSKAPGEVSTSAFIVFVPSAVMVISPLRKWFAIRRASARLKADRGESEDLFYTLDPTCSIQLLSGLFGNRSTVSTTMTAKEISLVNADDQDPLR